MVIEGRSVRELARRRVLLASWAAPVLLVVGASVVVSWPELALVAVLCAFFSYVFVSVALRQRREVAAAQDTELALAGDRISIGGEPARTIVRAIERPGYARIVSTPRRVVDYWSGAS